MAGITIQGLQEAQAENQRRIAMMQPDGAFGKAIQKVTTGAFRYLLTIIHVDTGTAKAAQRMQIEGLRGDIFIDRNATNPRTNQRPAVYLDKEFGRGGDHDSPARVVNEYGPTIVRSVISEII